MSELEVSPPARASRANAIGRCLIGAGILGWPVAFAILNLGSGLEIDYANRVAKVAGGLSLIAPLALLFGLALMRNWKAFVAVVLLGGAFFALLPILFPEGPTRPRNESAAVANLRAISIAEVNYLNSSGGRYGSLQELIDAGLLDGTFKTTKAGYVFKVAVTSDGKDYEATAWPQAARTGKYAYYSLTDAVVRYTAEHGGPCDPCFPQGQAGQPVN